MATSIFNMPSRKMLERVWQIDSIGKIMTYFCLFAQGEGWGCKERRRGTAKATGVLARRSALLISRVHNLIRMQLHIDAHTHTVSRAMLCSSWTVTYPPSFPPIMHPPPPQHTHTYTPPHHVPPIPLLFRFISVKNNESKHLQPWLHWCSNTQPANSKIHSGIKVKRGGWGCVEGVGGNLLLSNEIRSAVESGVQSSFAKTVRQIVVKEWPISRH